MNPRRLGIYVHVPFCLRKCSYCAFVSYPGALQPKRAWAYVDAALRELAARAFPKDDAYCGWTLFVGGGTPTVLGGELLSGLVSGSVSIMRGKGWPDPLEASVEANPGTFNSSGASMLVDSGVTRFSIGVQTLVDDELKAIGRMHSAEEAEAAIRAARSAGARSVSMDLMTGLPGQDMKSLSRTLDKVAGLGPDHVSCYALMLEEGTPLMESVRKGEIRLPDDELCADLMEEAQRALERMGLLRYEISNYASKGHECLHNLGYWSDMPYIGIGTAAHSYDPASSVRSWNTPDPDRYVGFVSAGLSAEVGKEGLSKQTAMSDALILSLRTCFGASLDEIESAYGAPFPTERIEALAWGEAAGLVESLPERRYKLTAKGMMLSNTLFVKLV